MPSLFTLAWLTAALAVVRKASCPARPRTPPGGSGAYCSHCGARSARNWRRSASPGRRLGEADENVEVEVLLAQVLEVVAFHDLDAAVAGGEGVAVLGDPRGGDDDALGGVDVFHGAG